MGILDGKRVLIIGVSGGIGFTCAKKCLAEGAAVYGTFRNKSEKLAEIEKEYPNSFSCACLDLSETGSIGEKIKSAVRTMGGIDVLINAAGIACPELIFAAKPENFEKVISCNLTAAFLVMQTSIDDVYMIDVPNGFEIIYKDEIFEWSTFICYEYYKDDNYIFFTQYLKSDYNVNVNTENRHLDYIEINGNNGYIVDLDNNEYYISWDNGDYIFDITGNIGKNALIKAANSVQKAE